MSIKVIGAGFGRTGTTSTKAALERLGLAPCYHMREILQPRPGFNDGHLDAWHAFATGRGGMDWEWLLQHYEAVLDHPVCLFYEDLLEIFPDAKVVLNVREPEAWFRSWATLWRAVDVMKRLSVLSPRMRKAADVVDALIQQPLGGKLDEAHQTQIFQAHVSRVIDTVEPERLLVYDVKLGWEPLCAFLDREVPDEPFPRLNQSKGSTVQKLMQFWWSTRKPVEAEGSAG